MANRGPYQHVPYRWQNFSFHCWLNSIEMLMQWKYGTPFGQERTGARAMRNAHTAGALRAVRGFGSHIALHEADYGLRKMNVADDLPAWQLALRTWGPIIASGPNFGPARLCPRAGHVVLIVGWSATGKLAYYDPFLIGWKAAWGNHFTYMTPAECGRRVDRDEYTQNYWSATWHEGDRPRRIPQVVPDAFRLTAGLLPR